jgi:uncharacterized protein (TIGR02646 family)
MRHIVKNVPPTQFVDWLRLNKASAPQNCNYNSLPTREKDCLKQALLLVQGFLCAYTMRRIDTVADCHIEHIIPQAQNPALDLDFPNMLACFPKSGGDVTAGYGAPIKGGAHVQINVNFVTPAQSGCETRFLFTKDGRVTAAHVDLAAIDTINKLKLDHPQLIDLRAAALQANGIAIKRSNRTRQALKTASEARRFASEVLKPDNMGRIEPFCIALSQVALEYANKEDSRAARLRTKPQPM